MTNFVVADADEAGWDDEVDLICVGPDSVALAVAIAADAAGRDVLLVDSVGVADAETLAGRLGLTGDSAEYLDAVTDDCGALVPAGPPEPLMVRSAADPLGPRPSGIVTFSGAALRNWAAECLASPNGLLSTTAAEHDAATVVVGQLDPGRTPDIAAWLRERAADLTADVTATLTALELCGGQVAGVSVSTPDGVTRIRAVEGVVIANRPAGPLPDGVPEELPSAGTAELVLLTRPFSRFARLELHV